VQPEPLRRLSILAAASVAVVILVLTLLVSPAEGDTLSRLLPAGLSLAGDDANSDVCVGGLACEDGHALAFLALGLFAAVHVSASWPPSERLRPLARLLVVLVAFAALDEFAQRWAGRDAALADWLADIAGVFLGVILGSQLTRILLRR